jgi:L-lactate dehydrogenase complex protein LldG
MSDARSRIFSRLRAIKAEAHPESPDNPVRRFDWTRAERLERFRARMESVRGEVHLVGADWSEQLLGLLREKGGGNLLYGPGGPHGSELEGRWPDRDAPLLIPYQDPVEICRDALFEAVDAGFTSCRGAIADTGSLVLWPTPDEPRLLSLAPPIHFVLLEADQIYSTFHELLIDQCWSAGMPTNALLVSGPSKSADIEQTLAYGVHGPKALVVLVRAGSPTGARSAGMAPT